MQLEYLAQIFIGEWSSNHEKVVLGVGWNGDWAVADSRKGL